MKSESTVAAVVETLPDYDPHPVPFSHISRQLEGGAGIAGIETIGDDQRAPVPFPDAAARQVTPGQSAFQDVFHPVRGFQGQEIKEQPQASAPVTGGYPGAATNNLSRPARYDLAQEQQEVEEEKVEEFLHISCAFLAEPTDPVEAPFVTDAELVEPELSLKKYHTRAFLAFAVLAAALGIGLWLGISSKRSSPESVRHEIEKNVLQRNATFSTMNPSDNRARALKWITEEDQLKLSVSDPNMLQRYILVLLSFQFSLDEGNGWLQSEKSECDWSGVSCGFSTYGTDQVSGLSLDGKDLRGEIPPEISGLKSLQTLTVYNNSLSGTLPPEIGNLALMTTLNLGLNYLNGTLPLELGKMTELTTLNLSSNQFTGTLPSELRQLNKPADLRLDLWSNPFCTIIEVSVTPDPYPEDTHWKMYAGQTDTDAMDRAIVLADSMYFDAPDGTSSHQVCLPGRGNYTFAIFDKDGICCSYGQGSYVVRTVNEPLEVIAQGGEFRESDFTTFSVPIIPYHV